jgi:hypothetical protein
MSSLSWRAWYPANTQRGCPGKRTDYNLPPDTVTTSRTFRPAALQDEAALAHLLDMLTWIVRCVK